MSAELTTFTDRIAVVTGGASGIGKGLVQALLEEGAKVVIADIEQSTLDATVAELSPLGEVTGMITDVTSEQSTDALAAHVFDTYGNCHLLFNNAGVTSGGGGKPWEQEPNDWRWCHGVNVQGVANCVISFVGKMVDSGEPGRVINTSSGDGGFAPVPRASVYAASKAAVSMFTEALAHQLISEDTNVRASVFYPSGGLLDTGLFSANRNRPDDLARVNPGSPKRSMTFDELVEMMKGHGHDGTVMNLLDLGHFVLQGIREDKYVISHGLDDVAELLHSRADAIGQGNLPPAHNIG